MTDWDGYANVLQAKLDYTNTYYHQEPKLDIVNPPADLIGKLDFIITSDVMEHVPPPIQPGFNNLAKLLKPSGVLILTVPFTQEPETREHFPDLHNFTIENVAGKRRLRNVTRDNREQIFDDLVFHGGDGSTLEMRLFCERALIKHLNDAGFGDVMVHREPFLKFGIYSGEPWSLPITASRKR